MMREKLSCRDGTETLTLKDIEAAFGSDMNHFSPPTNLHRKMQIFFDRIGNFLARKVGSVLSKLVFYLLLAFRERENP